MIQPKHFLCSFLAGNLIVGRGEVLKINTTAPSIVNDNCPSCNYNTSHENRSSSSSAGEHLAAVIRFSGNIEFRNGSTVHVFGKYGLSITSQNGHILLETDIDMTCTEKVLDETCLGGFTQSSVEEKDSNMNDLYKGKRICFYFSFSHLICSCLLGTCPKLAGRRGGGNFKFGFGDEVTHPCNGSEIC